MEKSAKPKNTKLSKKKWLTAAIIAAALCSGIAIYLLFSNNAAMASASQGLSTITLNKTEITNTIAVSRQVDSSNVVNIYSSLSNYPINEILVETGNSVEKGAVLARIDISTLTGKWKKYRPHPSQVRKQHKAPLTKGQ